MSSSTVRRIILALLTIIAALVFLILDIVGVIHFDYFIAFQFTLYLVYYVLDRNVNGTNNTTHN